jgi:hypothetical protein
MKHNRKGYRRVRMSQEMIQMFEEQKQRFRAKFGRDPRPDDPVIWDEDADEPRPVSEEHIHQIILRQSPQPGLLRSLSTPFRKPAAWSPKATCTC